MSHKASSSKRVGRTIETFRVVVDDSPSRAPAAMDALDSLDSFDAFDALLPPSDSADRLPGDRLPGDLASGICGLAAALADDASPSLSEQPIDSQLSTFLCDQPASVGCESLDGIDPLADGLPVAVERSALQTDRLRQWEADLRQLEARLNHDELDLAARRRDLAKQLRRHYRTTRRADSASTDLRLAELQSQFEMLVLLLRDAWPSGGGLPTERAEPVGDRDLSDSDADVDADADAVLRIRTLEQRIEALVEQNDQLASELAHLAVQRTVDQSSDATASLSWEERKALLYRQFESEECSRLGDEGDLGASQVECELRHELACMQHELRSRDAEIEELRSLLEQRPQVEGSELAIGAAAITRLFDDDEMIREERSRLKEIQAEWETKFRDMEIAASIERANLARERRQLECQNAELEEQLAHLKQELRQESIAGPAQTRRWFAKLGLGE
jgi:hypothetical protein